PWAARFSGRQAMKASRLPGGPRACPEKVARLLRDISNSLNLSDSWPVPRYHRPGNTQEPIMVTGMANFKRKTSPRARLVPLGLVWAPVVGPGMALAPAGEVPARFTVSLRGFSIGGGA